MLLSQAERVYAESKGEFRNYVGVLIGQFQDVLNEQDPINISKAQHFMRSELTRLENELRILPL